MATAQRYPRDILLETDAEYQRLAEQHSKYEAELEKLSATPYLNSEDLLEEIKLKKIKLNCKDEMERIGSRVHRDRSHSQYPRPPQNSGCRMTRWTLFTPRARAIAVVLS